MADNASSASVQSALLTGTANFNGGSLTGNWTVTEAGVLNTTPSVGGGITLNNQIGATVQVDSGAISFIGTFANAGTLRFGISGVGSNGVINVGNPTVLGGTFAASLLGGFTPVVGQ